jgi:hypothetical protein
MSDLSERQRNDKSTFGWLVIILVVLVAASVASATLVKDTAMRALLVATFTMALSPLMPVCWYVVVKKSDRAVSR